MPYNYSSFSTHFCNLLIVCFKLFISSTDTSLNNVLLILPISSSIIFKIGLHSSVSCKWCIRLSFSSMQVQISPFFSNESTLLEIRVFETPNTTFNSVLVVIVELFFKTIKIDISFGEKIKFLKTIFYFFSVIIPHLIENTQQLLNRKHIIAPTPIE